MQLFGSKNVLLKNKHFYVDIFIYRSLAEDKKKKKSLFTIMVARYTSFLTLLSWQYWYYKNEIIFARDTVGIPSRILSLLIKKTSLCRYILVNSHLLRGYCPILVVILLA